MICVAQDIKPPSTKLSSPMPEAENTSWTQSTIPAVEIREEKVIDSDVQDDKRVSCFTPICISIIAMRIQ